MKCIHCNGEHPDDTKYCPNTGKKIEPMFKACKNPDCPDYGKYILPLEARYCSKCGFQIPGEVNENSKKINGHEYVDLGLPSGTLWATCNVGASSPSDCGNYYAWGETSTKSSYDWKNLKYDISGSGDEFSKYVANSKYGDIDNKTRLEMQDDAARANWGGSWRMPTDEEWEELYDCCTWQWTSQGGHNGYKVISDINSKSIFLPAAGCCYGSSLYGVGGRGHFWSRSLGTEYSSNAYECCFRSSEVGPSGWDYRYYGQSVRPVSSSSQN